MLLVDDNADIRETVHELLLGEGFSVQEAVNGREALQQLESMARPCVMLLDLMMPVMDGLEVLRVLEERPELVDGVSVVVWTAAPHPQFVQAHPLVREVLTKPFDVQQLFDLVERHCG